MNQLPYSSIFESLLIAIHNALGYCHLIHSQKRELSERDQFLIETFKNALNIDSNYGHNGLDAHIISSLNKSEENRNKDNAYPRLVKLVIFHYLKTQKGIKKNSRNSIVLPSPLQILYHALTVPEHSQTAAYAFVTCRDRLFYYLKLHPEHPDLGKEYFAPFTGEEIFNAIVSFKNHEKIQLRWPGNTIVSGEVNSRVNYLCGHVLALKGYANLWFSTKANMESFCSIENKSDLHNTYQIGFKQKSKYQFRFSPEYYDIPDISEINNWIFGVPLPIRGADILFSGGVKKTYAGGLVISLYGQPGSGKTSTALTLAAAMSPFNTKTLYLSLEEEPEDLKIRLHSLVPEYLRKLSIYENNFVNVRGKKNHEIEWFKALKFSDNVSIGELTDILKEIKDRITNNQRIAKTEENVIEIPATCPLIIVIDNINELFEKENISYKEIEEFISQCRSMGAFVVLIAAEDIPVKHRIDYLVDIAIHLKHVGIESKYEKPIRVIQLLKTRHQVSRQGTHVFHLSNSKGFRVSPQVPSQMDKKEKNIITLPSKTEFIPTVNIHHTSGQLNYINVLNIASRSQIIIHGNGSSGKAGFALKLLLTPEMRDSDLVRGMPVIESIEGKYKIKLPHISKRKVLVISFLYPEEYYEDLGNRITNQFKSVFKDYNQRNAVINVKAFYPGFLTPEDFVNKIVRLLEQEKLEGDPYTGVLLDGLHNVFLQFKNLQDAHMVWPLLYSMLTRYNLTVVSTFTNFSVNDTNNNDGSIFQNIPQDSVLLQEGQKPFLHGLVKACDYFLILEEKIENSKRIYQMKVKGSIRSTPPIESFIWEREKLTLSPKNELVKSAKYLESGKHNLPELKTDETKKPKLISIGRNPAPPGGDD